MAESTETTFDFSMPGMSSHERLACPKCGRETIAASYVPDVNGSVVVDLGDGRSTFKPGGAAGYTCWQCDYEAPTKEPFIAAGKDKARQERAEARKAAAKARQQAENELQGIVDALIGRTITAVRFHAEDSAPGFDSAPDIESVTITLDDGAVLDLAALGWHDIQSLIVNLEPAPVGAQ